jgi:uncharacterized protein (DUF736 family)
MNGFTNVGGAWEKTTRGGQPFIVVKLELPDGTETTVMLFRNKFKLNALDGRPDYICYLPTNEPEEKTPEPF